MRIVILGAGGHAKVVIDMIRRQKGLGVKEIDLLDDGIEAGTVIGGCEVKGNLREVLSYKEDTKFIIAIGNNGIRKRIADTYALDYITLIHPNAVVGSDVRIGKGSVIMAGAVINSGTRIGKHCIINTGATVDHDNSLKDFVHISPGAHLGGMVQIGMGSWIGIGSSIKNNVNITDGVIIGAGGVVIKDIEQGGTYVGVPARRLENYFMDSQA